MRIDVNKTINNYDDQPIIQSVTKDEKTGEETKVLLTIGGMIINVLNQPQESDKDIRAEEKIERAILSQEIHNLMKAGGEGFIHLESERVTELKKLFNAFYQPLALMRAYNIIDPQPKEVKKAK